MVATVHGEWHNASGPRAGSYAVYLPVRLTDPAGDLIYPAGLFASGALVAGEFSVAVPGSDDPDVSPQDWQLDVRVSFSGGKTERYSIPVADGTTVELADVVLPQTLGDPEPVLIRGVPGGIAELDEDGLVPVDQLPAFVAAAVVHTQASALASWSITHNLGRFPVISVYVGGSEVIADVDVTTSNATVTFAAPAAGVAVLA